MCVYECLPTFSSYLKLISYHAFEISHGVKEEVCLTQRTATDDKYVIKAENIEIYSMLREMKTQITRLNDEEDKTPVCEFLFTLIIHTN